jgi:trans-2,3-dihydro-3-hydroxyanthranilate isomerase
MAETMRVLRYVLCDVFTSRPLEGNPLAVFTNAQGVPASLMQRLACETNLSETTFVLPAERGGHARVRIFTPRRELPFAGHPVLGTALVVGSAMESREVRLELEHDTVPVSIERDGARATFGWMKQPLPQRLPLGEVQAILDALRVRPSELPIELWTNGPEHLLVPVAGREAVAGVAPDLGALARLTSAGVSVFAHDAEGVKTRMFAPAAGVPEDPATGSAAGALGAYLRLHGLLADGETLRIEQGEELGRPSELFVRVTGDASALQEVSVGGGVQVVARGEFRLHV